MALNWRNVSEAGISAADFSVLVSYKDKYTGTQAVLLTPGEAGFTITLVNGVLTWKWALTPESLLKTRISDLGNPYELAIVFKSPLIAKAGLRFTPVQTTGWTSADATYCRYGVVEIKIPSGVVNNYVPGYGGDILGAGVGAGPTVLLDQTDPYRKMLLASDANYYGVLASPFSFGFEYTELVGESWSMLIEFASFDFSTAEVSVAVIAAEKRLRLFRKLLPRKLQTVDAWRDYADAMDLVLSHAVLDPAMGIPGIRDPNVIEEDMLPQLSELLGFSLRSDYYDERQKRFIVGALYQYYAYNGTPAFESFLAVLAKYQIKLNVLWTNNYRTFQRYPGGKTVYEDPISGDWFLTPHYEIYLDGEGSYEVVTSTFSGALGVRTSGLGHLALGSHLGSVVTYHSAVDENLVESMFYDFAPVQLVLDRIVRGYVAQTAITVSADALPSLYTGREYNHLVPFAALVDRVVDASAGLVFVQGYLSNIRNEPVQVHYHTEPGTVFSPSSYVAASGVITIPALTNSFRIPVTITQTAQNGQFRVVLDESPDGQYRLWKNYANVFIVGQIINAPPTDSFVVLSGTNNYCGSESTISAGMISPISNPDFELGNVGFVQPPQYVVQSSGGYSGSKFMRRTGVGLRVDCSDAVFHRVDPGVTVTLTGRIRIPSAGDIKGGRLWIYFYDSAHNTIGYGADAGTLNTTNGNWQLVTASGAGPAGTMYCRVVMDSTVSTTGTSDYVDFDNLQWDLIQPAPAYNLMGVGIRLLPGGAVQWLQNHIDSGSGFTPVATDNGRWYTDGNNVNPSSYESRFTEETSAGVFAAPTPWVGLGDAVSYYHTTAMQTPTSGASWIVGTLEIRNKNSLAIVRTVNLRAVAARQEGGNFCATWPSVADFALPSLPLTIFASPSITTIPNTGTETRTIGLVIGGGAGSYVTTASVVNQPSRGTLSIVSISDTQMVVSAGVASSTTAGTNGLVRVSVVSGASSGTLDIIFVDTLGSGGGSGGGGGCPTIGMFVESMRGTIRAGDVMVGDSLRLGDCETGTEVWGVVTHSAPCLEPCVRIELDNGLWLESSASAPIATAQGPMLAPEVAGLQVYNKLFGYQGYSNVTSVSDIGECMVQFITVGDRYYWVGGSIGQYVLHHNLKRAPSDGLP